ncbi:MAG: TonB-dependent receptor, partial [Blastocatellia bacterium]|nr:TonB-dependent receptor [Blastocatellia bacterium]
AVVRPFDNSGGGDISLGGGNASSNEILLNGIPNMEDSSRTAGFSPLIDAVDEIRVDQFESNAAYGDTSGGTVNITTKSGTNQFHGTLSEFNETSALAAGLWFNNANGIKNPVTRQNQYGGTIGGPIIIPKVFNGHNKLFFFYAYEGFKDSTPTSVFATVPTVAERGGDLSALLALGKNYQLYNPYSGVLSNGKVTRQPFAGNMIPISMLNPVALAYLQFYPQPNLPGKADGEQNFISTTPNADNYFSNMGRLDYNINDTNKLFFELHQSHWLQTAGNVFQNIATGNNTEVDMWGGVLDEVHTFSPTLVLDTRLGFSRTINSTNQLPSTGFDASSLGFPSYIDANSTIDVLPRITLSDAATLGGKTGSPAYFDNIQLFATLTKVWGSHTFKVGPDIRANKLSQLGSGYSSGSFTFGSSWVTSGTGASAQPFGSSLASLLLGLPTAGQFDITQPTTSNNWYTGGFIQDDWKIKQNLTLNLGLRVEHETPVVESNNRITVGFDPTAVNSVTQAAEAAYASIYAQYAAANPLLPAVSAFQPTGGLVFATPANRSGYSTATTLLSPRIGLAWAPGKFHNNTVFRGGFGIFYNPFNDYNTGPSTGFSQTTLLVQPSTFLPSDPATSFLSNPFPATNPIQQPAGSSLGFDTGLWNDIAFYTPNPKNAYSVRWSFDIQHQFSKDLMLDIGYIGAHQVNLSYSNCLSSSSSDSSCNGIPPLQYLTTSPIRDDALTSAMSTSVPNPFLGLIPGVSKMTQVYALLGPYPEFTGVTQKIVPGGYAWFHMLAVRLTKRFSSGLQFNINYEHSRQLETSQLQGGGPLVYTETSSDFPNHFVLTGSYDLPFGRGAKFWSNTNRLVNALVGGWTLNAIYIVESGAPISWGNMIYNGRPLHYDPTNLAQAFDVTQFDRNSNDQPNNYNYRTFPQMFNNLRSQGANNADLSLMKNFSLRERIKLQFRFEAFNALNRTQFAGPNLDPTKTTFGTITAQANSARVIQMGLRLQF